jgi:hypothetical protein
MVIDFKTEFSIDIEYSKVLRGKEHALEMIRRTFEDRYKTMPQYCSDVEATNLGSIASLELLTIDLNGCSSLSAPVQWVLLIVVLSSVSTVLISKRNTKAFFLLPLQLML